MAKQNATSNGDSLNSGQDLIDCRAPAKVPVGVALFNKFSFMTQNLVVVILAMISGALAGTFAFTWLDSMFAAATNFLQFSLAAVAYVFWKVKHFVLPASVQEYFNVPQHSPWMEVDPDDLEDQPRPGVRLDRSERLADWTQTFLQNFSATGKVPLPVSMINNVDPTFAVPKFYDASKFPYARPTGLGGAGWGYNDINVHLLSLLIKLSYEHTSIMLTVMKRPELGWKGWRLNNKVFTETGTFSYVRPEASVPVNESPASATGEANQAAQDIAKDSSNVTWQEHYIARSVIPKTRAFILSNDNAAVVLFRGTEPTNLVQWATDAQLGFARPRGYVKGRVHMGFFQALFYKRPSSPSPAIFWQICDLLESNEQKDKAVFVTGHSLGGALTSVFAHALAYIANEPAVRGGPTQEQRDQCKRIYNRILAKGCVVTFAGPMVGDGTFMAYSSAAYGYNVSSGTDHCLIRVVHAADIVPQVPFYEWLYRHHTKEYYITTFGWVMHMPQDVEAKRSVEVGPVMYWFLFLYKLVNGFVAEFPVRTLERLMLWWLPLSDHWPCDYERKLRLTTEAVILGRRQ